MWNERYKRRLQRVGLIIFSCFIALVAIEVALSIPPYIRQGTVGRSEKIELRRATREPGTQSENGGWENLLVPHPLFGFVYNRKVTGVNNFGFPCPYNIALSDSGYAVSSVDKQKALIVGIFGGSFSQQLRDHAGKYLENRLAMVFPERLPVVMNFAIGGHSLPQTAYIFLYFRELFDVIVFVDGLNELWNAVDNNKAGSPPEYASAVHYGFKLSLNELSPENFQRTSRILAASQNLRRVTDISLSPVLKYSVLGHHVWSVLAGRLQEQIAEESNAIKTSYQQSARFFGVDDNHMRDLAARQWEKHHTLIHEISKSLGILDIHLIQPNPFVPESKVLTSDEVGALQNWISITKDHVVMGYPKLRQALTRLQRNTSVIGQDLTFLFKDETKSIWTDGAHANPLGYQRVADIIVELIRTNKASLRSRSRDQ